MKVSTLAIAAVIGLAVPATAFAQMAPAPVTPTAPAQNAGTPMAGDVGAEDFGMFVQGLGTADYTAATSSLSSATTFEVVKLSTMPNADATALDGALSQRQADITSLHTGISANAQASAALEAAGVTADQVVWIDTEANGAVKLYVNDLAM